VVLLAVALDAAVGEPRRWHPLVGFGRWAGWLESRLYRPSRGAGILALTIACAPFVIASYFLDGLFFDGMPAAVLILYLAIGARSLFEHAARVAEPLARGELEAARAAVGRIVSRHTAELDAAGVSRAAVESVLENGNDAIFGAIFWFVVLGVPGVLLYRLVNTLDATWGYRNARYRQFGWAAARLDDLLNYFPARLTALSYAVVGRASLALVSWREQGRLWESPNAGPVMAAGAGALALRLGGLALYHGQWRQRPWLGAGREPEPADIDRAVALVRRALLLWLVVLVLVDGVLLHA